MNKKYKEYIIILVMLFIILAVPRVSLAAIPCHTPEECAKEFKASPTPEAFSRLANPTAEDLRAVVGRGIEQFKMLSTAEQQKYIAMSDFVGVDRQFADSFFSNPANVNQNKNSFTNYIKELGATISMKGNIALFNLDGTLFAKNGDINILQFKDDYSFEIDRQGNLLLIDKWKRVHDFKGAITRNSNGNIALSSGSIDGLQLLGGNDIVLHEDGTIVGSAVSMGGMGFENNAGFEFKKDLHLLIVNGATDGGQVKLTSIDESFSFFVAGTIYVKDVNAIDGSFHVREGTTLSVNDILIDNTKGLRLPKKGYLEIGDTGGSVSRLQHMLSKEGFLTEDHSDGEYDSMTEDAVREWQQHIYEDLELCVGKKKGSSCEFDGVFGKDSKMFTPVSVEVAFGQDLIFEQDRDEVHFVEIDGKQGAIIRGSDFSVKVLDANLHGRELGKYNGVLPSQQQLKPTQLQLEPRGGMLSIFATTKEDTNIPLTKVLIQGDGRIYAGNGIFEAKDNDLYRLAGATGLDIPLSVALFDDEKPLSTIVTTKTATIVLDLPRQKSPSLVKGESLKARAYNMMEQYYTQYRGDLESYEFSQLALPEEKDLSEDELQLILSDYRDRVGRQQAGYEGDILGRKWAREMSESELKTYPEKWWWEALGNAETRIQQGTKEGDDYDHAAQIVYDELFMTVQSRNPQLTNADIKVFIAKQLSRNHVSTEGNRGLVREYIRRFESKGAVTDNNLLSADKLYHYVDGAGRSATRGAARTIVDGIAWEVAEIFREDEEISWGDIVADLRGAVHGNE